MQNSAFTHIFDLITEFWARPAVWPGYKELLFQAIMPVRKEGAPPRASASEWLRLPGLCCQAVGGDPQAADRLTAAWFLFYRAAHLMDSVQDQDEPEPWWAEAGPGAALSAATGLFFTATAILEDLHNQLLAPGAGPDILQRFSDSFLTMGSGQYLDLVRPSLALEEYWQVAEAKSGAFFGLACWAGARLASQNLELLERFQRFGNQIGLLIQIGDDLDELGLLAGEKGGPSLIPGPRALPVVYARAVLPAHDQRQLSAALEAAEKDAAAAGELREILEKSGAALYILAELHRHYQIALAELREAGPETSVSRELIALLERFNPDRLLRS